MKRLPLLPTLIVLLAVPTMIALGVWQLQRAEWKSRLLERLAVNAHAPVIEAPADLAAPKDELSFRRVRVVCTRLVDRDPTAARSVDGAAGYRQIRLCQRTAGEPLLVSLGVGSSPDRVRIPVDGAFVGTLVPRGGTPAFLLVSEAPARPLAREAPPTLDSIPNNHRAYAVQWFLFALILTLVYVAYLRQRHKE